MKKLILFSLLMYVFTNSNCQWTQVYHTSATASIVAALSAPNDNICWFVSNFDSLYKTNDGGATWTTAGSPAFLPAGLFVLNNDTAFKAASASIYKTTNGGVTWTNVFSSTGFEVPVVWMKNDSVGIFSFGGQLYKTTNGGNTWSTATINQPPVAVINSPGKGTICNFRGDSIWVVLVGGGVAFSPDYGTTWTVPSNTGWTSTNYANISFDGPLLGLAVMHNNPFVFVTHDGGNNWTQSINTLGANEDVVVKGSHCWFIPDPNDHFYIKYSADSGTTWTQQLFNAAGFNVLDKSRTGNTIWSGTTHGQVYKYIDNVTSGIDQNIQMMNTFEINPAISSNEFVLTSSSKEKTLKIKVYDIAGKKIIDVLVKDHTATFGTQLKAGLYIVTVSENGKTIFNEKIIKTN